MPGKRSSSLSFLFSFQGIGYGSLTKEIAADVAPEIFRISVQLSIDRDAERAYSSVG